MNMIDSLPGRYHWLLACQICLLLLLTALPLQAQQVLVYPQAESDTDNRSSYPLKLLELALHKAGMDAQLRPSTRKMPQGRALIQLASGLDVDVVWSMTSKQREQDLLPIRIPIDKGLLGWRIFLIESSKQSRFAQINTLAQLKQLQAGQGHDWPDTLILRSNGLPVVGEAKYEGLFQLLKNGAIDYFPRSINEIQEEIHHHPGQGLAIETGIVLRYPAALYFFVNKNNQKLAQNIERGLRLAIKDGSFEKLFNQFHQKSIEQANLRGRKLFQLNNPLLPEATLLDQKELWFEQ